MRLPGVWLYLSGIFATYYCMSLWGLGLYNPVKYYLYALVIVFSFLLTRELRQYVRHPFSQSVADTGLFLVIITLIIAGTSAVLFSEYELWVIAGRQHTQVTCAFYFKLINSTIL